MDFIEIEHADKCTNCYKCVQQCFTKAININANLNTVDIDRELCVECGFCTDACKANIPYIQTNFESLTSLLSEDKKIYLILDTIYQSDFENLTINQIRQAARKVGFSDVIENFTGFALHRYLTYEHYKKTNKATIETFCITFNNFVSKFYPDLSEYMAPIQPPENISSRLIKEKYGKEIYTVYATTCFAQEKKNTDYDCDIIILTSELNKLFEKYNINPHVFQKEHELINEYEFIPPSSEKIDTIQSCTEILEYIRNNKNYSEHISPYWCDTCFSSPVFTNNKTTFERKKLYDTYKKENYNFISLNHVHIKQFGDLSRFTHRFKPSPVNKCDFSDKDINSALLSIDRFEDNGHFDCGACGYSTCRDFAISLLSKKSIKSQCVPYVSKLYQESLNNRDKAYKELDEAFALTIPNSRLEKKLKHTKEFKDQYIKETGKIKIIDVIEDGTYRHVVNALKVAADLHSKGVMSVIGFDKDFLVKTIIFHDIGKSQPALNVGDEVYPKEIFEDGKMHAERSAELALANYSHEGINNDIYFLIKYHHHNERELPLDFPEHLLPMYRLFRVIDGISAGLTRRGNTITFDLIGSVLYIKECSQNPNFRRFYSIDLYKPEYLKKDYDFDDTLETMLNTGKYK